MKTAYALVAAGAAFLSAPASAAIYQFSSNFTSGPNTGTLTGLIDLAFGGTGANGSGAATSLTITGTPAGIGLPQGPVATSWTNVVNNSFTVTNGAITSFLFFSITGPGATADTELCLNSGPSGPGLGSRVCPANLNFLGLGGATEYGFNFNGAQGITFTLLRDNAVPEPATWAMLILGFGVIGGAMRRRRDAGLAVA